MFISLYAAKLISPDPSDPLEYVAEDKILVNLNNVLYICSNTETTCQFVFDRNNNDYHLIYGSIGEIKQIIDEYELCKKHPLVEYVITREGVK